MSIACIIHAGRSGRRRRVVWSRVVRRASLLT